MVSLTFKVKKIFANVSVCAHYFLRDPKFSFVWFNGFNLSFLMNRLSLHQFDIIRSVVLGGTNQLGNYSEEVSLEDREHIMRETRLLEPSLAVSMN